MENRDRSNDLDLSAAFEIILSNNEFSDYISDIAQCISVDELNREVLNGILEEYKVQKIDDIKNELLDLVILYLKIVVNDKDITDKERLNVLTLKRFFKIKEGDFYSYKYDQIKEFLNDQFSILFLDNKISYKESIYSAELQGLFDLGRDQIEEFKEEFIRKAVEEGADITDLDTTRYPK